MKKLLFFFALLFMGAMTVFAQVPTNQQLTYQTVVRNAQNQLVFSQNNVSVTVEVCNLDGSVVRYSETHTGLSTNANGLLTLMVGGGTRVSGAWTDIVWSDAAIRTTITYNPGTGTVTIPSGLAPVSAVPYALQAGSVTNITNIIGDAIHDSIVNNISEQIHDSLTNALNDYTIQNCDDVNDCVSTAIADGNSVINHAIDTVVLNNVGDAIADGNSEINHAIDTVVLNNVGDAIADGNSVINHAIDTVVLNNIGDAIADGNSDINHAIDTIVNNITSNAIHDSLTNALNDYEIQNCDDVNNCVSTAIADGNSVINHAIDTVVLNNVSDAIADGNSEINHAIDTVVLNNVGDAIADGNSDINHAIDTIVNNIAGSAIHDSLTNALNDYTIQNCDDVNDCVSTAIADGNSVINHAIDTVVLNNVGDAIADGNSEINHAIDTVVLNNVGDAIADGNSDINHAIDTIVNNITSSAIHDSLTNALNDYEIQNCDDVNNCVSTAIADGNSVINHAIDTVVLNNIGGAIADGNSDINHAIDTVVLNNIGNAIADGNSDINHAIDTIVNNITSSAIHDSLTNALNDYEIQNCDDVNNCVSTAIADGNSVINHAIDTVVLNNVSGAIADGNSDINHAIDTVVLNNVGDAIADGNSDINHAIDTVVLNNIGNAIADGNSDINHAIDTIVNNITSSAIHDSLTNALNDYEIQNCDDVNKCVANAIANGNSDINHAIDTVVANIVHDSIASNIANHIGDAIHDSIVNNISGQIHDSIVNISGDLTDLENRVNTFNTHVCDSVRDCVTGWIHDSIANNIADNIGSAIHDSIVNNISSQIHDSIVNISGDLTDLENRVNTFNTHVCDSVQDCIKNYLNDNHYVTETVMGNAIHDSITNNITNTINTQIHDSIADISDDLTALTDRVNTFNTHVCDSVRDCVTGWIHDSIANNIADNIGSAIHDSIVNNISEQIHDSIVYNINNTISEQIHDTVSNYLTNNHYVTETDLCNTIETNCTNVVLKNGDNIFIGDNDFTDGSITVPNAIVPDLATVLADTCNQKAVNLCDLLAVFDSLCRRIEKLENAIPPVANAPTVSNVTSTSMNVKANAISQGAAITSYEFCISTNSDMSGATCQTVLASDADNYTFTGLDPNTNYYVQYSATNFAGTTTSPTVQERTLAHAPTADVTPPAPTKPAGFDVPVDNVDPKEKDEATVQVCYVLKGSGDCPEKESPSYSDCSDPVTVTDGGSAIISKTGLEASTEYCVIVKVSNGDSTTIYGPWSVTTGEDVTMTISGPSDTILCGASSIALPYMATITGDDANNFSFAWSAGTSTTSKDTVSLTGGTHTITVTATHNTENYTLTATASTTVNSGTAATLKLCEDPSIGKVLVDNTNCTSLSWKNASDVEVSTSITELAIGGGITAGVYTVTGVNASGCSITKQTVLGNYSPRPCTSASMGTHPAQTTGIGNATDGMETVEGGNITSVKDYDGNEYPVVEIGTQCWMAVNLRTTHYADGNSVPYGTTSNRSNTDPYYYDNTSSSIPLVQRGYHYNWPAAMKSTTTEGTQGVCPTGWHVPTIADWQTMVAAADASTSTGAVYLSSSCYWSGSTSGTGGMATNSYDNPERNKSGFSAVPAGYFSGSSFGYSYSGSGTYFWSSSVFGSGYSWYRRLISSSTEVYENNYYMYNGNSVRCVRN